MTKQMACKIPEGPERHDDPVGSSRIDAVLERFEETLVDVMKAQDRNTASTLVRQFSTFARAHAVGDWELAFVRRLELSAEASILLRFDEDVPLATRIAAELVTLPCHRRMAQLWEVLVLAGYCRDLGHPAAVWPYLLKAVRIVEIEIPRNDCWLADRESIRRILIELWNAIDNEGRTSLVPYVADG